MLRGSTEMVQESERIWSLRGEKGGKKEKSGRRDFNLYKVRKGSLMETLLCHAML